MTDEKDHRSFLETIKVKRECPHGSQRKMHYKRTLNLVERFKLLCFLMIERRLFFEPGVTYTPPSRTHEHNRFPCTPLA
jgi:hypothetical protein